MIKKLPADDLFEKSSMTFGEHLEELRRAVVKALLWLGVGVVIGLILGERIVRYIESPVKEAITGFYIDRAKQEFKAANNVEPSDELAQWMLLNNMQPQRAYVDPEALARLTQSSGSNEEQLTGASEAANQQELAAKLDLNPWKDMQIKQLNQLQPIVFWQTIPNKLSALTSMEPFMIYLKTALVAGFIFGAPGIFWHIWQFLAAGLYPHERRYVYWYIPLSLTLFFFGVCLAFFVIFRYVLEFLIGYSSSLDVEFTPRLNDYMSFAILLPLGFGLAFQLPIVMLGLHRFGLVNAQTFLTHWRVAVLVIAFLSMLLTPGGDPYSMAGMAIPLVLLYFSGILLCRYMPKGAGIGSMALDP